MLGICAGVRKVFPAIIWPICSHSNGIQEQELLRDVIVNMTAGP